MEFIVLQNGKQYPLAVNGFWASGTELKLKLVTDETVEGITQEFTKGNTQVLQVVSADGMVMNQAHGFVQMGDLISKRTNTVISVDIVPETTNEDGEVLTPAGLKENYGTVVEFSMYQEKIDTQVKQNRADIDYLLMMEESAV